MDGLRIKMALNEHQFKVNFRVDLIQEFKLLDQPIWDIFPFFIHIYDPNPLGRLVLPRGPILCSYAFFMAST